jgi:hypothetical protein
MSLSPERALQKKVQSFFQKLRYEGAPLWSQKLNDRTTAGLPDLIGVWRSQAWALELKAPGEVPTRLQKLTLAELRRAGAIADWTDSWEGFEKFWARVTA